MNKRPINISGISESRVAPVAADKAKSNAQALIIVSSATRAKRLAEDLAFFADKRIYVVPEEEGVFLHYEARSREQLFARMKALKALRSGEECIVIAPATAAVKRLPPPSVFEEASVRIERGGEVSLSDVKEKLAGMGYERVAIIESRGQFSVRGSIIDVFAVDAENPYRVELFDTEVDSIRSFDIDTQRSEENLKYIEIYPAEQLIRNEEIFTSAATLLESEYTKYIKKIGPCEAADKLSRRRDELSEYIKTETNIQLLENYLHYFFKEPSFIWDYAGDDTVIMVDDPIRCHEVLELRDRELTDDFRVMTDEGYVIPKDFEVFAGKKEFCDIYRKEGVYVFTPLTQNIKEISAYEQVFGMQSRQTPIFAGHMDMLESELKLYVKNGYKVTIVCSSKDRLENLRDFLDRAGLEKKVWLKEGKLSSGIEYPLEKRCWISDSDIFSEKKRTGRKTRPKNAKPVSSFADLRVGDYVVHENHGIGKFSGIEKITIEGNSKDYIKIKYAGSDVLYVPVEQMDIVQKYSGADDGAPKINKLSGSEWKATKARAKAAIADMASELLQLSAARKSEPGFAFSKDNEWQHQFEESFPFAETDDQLRCIAEIKKDMESPNAMDRLLCGDVGYGKTEVAARALFKCVCDGKQAAVLVPTTLLANQHYYTLKERFEKFPFKVEVMSRFRSEKQQSEIASAIGRGTVDVVIGTHRLLSKDVKFKNLGLLVVDEEQRFGVQHKEAIKMLKNNVDVLTLSATPIPRTLHMSLVGIRDMSVIEEPPEERYPVQTYVIEEEDQIIREVIERELARDGQVYVLYNKVRGISKVASRIAELVPEARVAVGHGQMKENELEKIMIDFINGESDVLVSTTIIESGIDIPNANTILILDADKLGLAQLYQLRGRVGRSNRIAYAYLMYKKDSVLSETAEKRLRAIKEFTEFGAGFKVAMRDLEIRGAGNLLGTEQHGHMLDVGYELYCKLVDDAVRALSGEVVNPDREEATIEIRTGAYIPDTYISDEVVKLQMYKKIALVESEEDEDEILDEMLDRFGDVPLETVNLTKVSRIRSLAEGLCITRVAEEKDSKGTRIVFFFAQENPLNPERLMNLSAAFGPRVFIHGGVKPFIRYSVEKDKLRETIGVLEALK